MWQLYKLFLRPCSNIQLSHSVMILSPVTTEPVQIQIQKYNTEYIVFVLSSIEYMSKRISPLDLDSFIW